MGLKLNEFPAATEEGLDLMLYLRDTMTNFGEKYSLIKLKSILTDSIIERIIQEQREVNSRLEQSLYKISMEMLFPLWTIEYTGEFSYTLKIEGRQMSLIDDDDFHGGHKQDKCHIACLDKKSCIENYTEFIFSDKRIDAGEISQYVPKEFDYVTAVIHCLKAIEKDFDKPKNRKNCKKHINGDELPNDYKIASNSLRFDFRNKSGAESIFKIVDWLRSRRGPIVDVAAARAICNDEDYLRKLVHIFESISPMYRGRGREGAMIIQSLNPDLDKTKRYFLDRLPRKFRREYEEIVFVEYKKYPLKNTKNLPKLHKDILMPYAEILIPVGTRKQDIYDNNPINLLLYPSSLFKAIDNQGLDPLSHKKRREDTRFGETYDDQDLDTCKILPGILEGQERRYVEDIIGYRRK